MISSCALVLLSLPAAPTPVQSQLVQLTPEARTEKFVRAAGQQRAVLLIHGFRLYFRDADIARPHFHGWQTQRGLLVRELARDADVFAFAYGQDAPVKTIVEKSGLRPGIARLKELGYREIVALGHSAGGLIARRLVEDHPDCGVTKVIQACAPNGGAPSAELKINEKQQPFLDCLSVPTRAKVMKERAKVSIPEKVEFVCFVALGTKGLSDGVVPCPAQWTPDLREQGIPAFALKVDHRSATRGREGARFLARLARESHPRWSAEQVRAKEQELFPDD